jgi:translation initiation factor 5A
MDMETFEVFEANLPDDKNIADKLENGAEVEYWKALNKQKIVRIRN